MAFRSKIKYDNRGRMVEEVQSSRVEVIGMPQRIWSHLVALVPNDCKDAAWVLGALMTGRAKQNDLGLWSLETWNVEAATGKAKEAF